ncbi:MAG: hypothetical protein HFH98_07855, partial [Lachnospiraceae bacterium]|nr:hypothetical protein [Lachnospiraceae bacterium]
MDTAKRTAMVLVAAVITAVNLKTFVRTGGLIPGGFTGLTRLLQEICDMVWGFACISHFSRILVISSFFKSSSGCFS